MSIPASASVFDMCRDRLDDLIEANGATADIGDFERTIDTYPLGRDEKAALWLWVTGRRDGWSSR